MVVRRFCAGKKPSNVAGKNFANMARCSIAGTTVATFTAAAQVRRNLSDHGYTPTKVDQRPYKRESLAATFTGTQTKTHLQKSPPNAFTPAGVTILGAGLGGAVLARQLAEQAIPVRIIDPNPRFSGASKINSAILHARLLGDGSPTARLRAEAYHFSNTFYQRFAGLERCGVIQAQGPNLDAEKMARISRAFAATHETQHNWIKSLSAQSAKELSSGYVSEAGLWFPGAGVVDIPILCADLLRHANITVEDCFPHAIEIDPRHTTIICCGAAARTLSHSTGDLDWLEIAEVAGQLDHYAVTPGNDAAMDVVTHLPTTAIVGSGYYAPFRTNNSPAFTVGATYEYSPWEEDVASQHNLSQNPQYHPTSEQGHQTKWIGRTRGIRAIASDREPVVGKLADNLWIATAYSSMGTTMAPLGASVIASQLLGWVPPVSAASEKLIHPRRFIERQARRGRKHI